MSRVELRQVSKGFGATPVLQKIDLAVEEGEFVVLVGPSGCGKSTLLRAIAGLDEVDSGEVLIDDRRVDDLPPAKRGIAMVFQSYALYPHMTVAANMAFGLKLAGKDRATIDKAVADAARLLDIEHLLDRKPKALSGGQRQRVAIGRAIVREPSVFLFDEPLSNLDAALRVKMRYEFAKLHQRLKTTTIYVTHDQVEAMTLADRIAILDRGRVEQFGTAEELYHRPASRFVAGFIGSPKMNFLEGVIDRVGLGQTTVTLPNGAAIAVGIEAGGARKGDAVTLGVRPEHLREDPAGAIAASMTLIESLGNMRFAYLDSDAAAEPLVMQLTGQAANAQGDKLRLAPDPGHCHLFAADGGALAQAPRPPGALAA